MTEEKGYEVTETEQDHLTHDNDQEKADLVNDDKNVPSDAAVTDIDPDPMTDEKMKEINDTSLGE